MTVTWDFSFNKLEKDLEEKPNLLQVGKANIKEGSTKKQTQKEQQLIAAGKQAKEKELYEPISNPIATIPKYDQLFVDSINKWNWG